VLGLSDGELGQEVGVGGHVRSTGLVTISTVPV
jgi:hypothetical protein